MSQDVFTTEELKILISALLEGENRGVSEGEITAFIKWAEGVRIDNAFVNLLLNQKLTVKWSAGEDDWVFQKREGEMESNPA